MNHRQKELLIQLESLADNAKTFNEQTIALVLYSLIGSVKAGLDRGLCAVVTAHNLQSVKVIRERMVDLQTDSIFDDQILNVGRGADA